MPSRVDARLTDVPLRNVTVRRVDGESGRSGGEGPRLNPTPNLTPRGALVDQARKVARIEVKQMADWMGVSESFLLRGFKDQEHLSWQRLNAVIQASPVFHQAFLILQAREVHGVTVTTHIEVKSA